MSNLGVTVIAKDPVARTYGNTTITSIEILDQECADLTTFRAVNVGVDGWQSFTCGTTGQLTKVSVYSAFAAGAATLEIYSGEGVGGSLLSTQAINITASGAWQQFTISSPPSLTYASTYSVNIRPTSFNWSWQGSTSDVYSGGRSFFSASTDMAFRTYITYQAGVGTITPSFFRNYYTEVSSYNHKLDAWGGFVDSSIQLTLNLTDALEWIFGGIGRHIEVYADDTMQIWEGLVNSISFSINGIDFNIGNYTDIGNKILVKYTDAATGVSSITTYVNDTNSQEYFGVLPKILSAGSVSATNAGRIAYQYLYEKAYPGKDISLNLSNSNNTMVLTLACTGYVNSVLNYNYNNTSTASVSAYTKITNILQADPNSLFSIFSFLEENTTTVSSTENQDRLALDIIKEITALGAPAIGSGMTGADRVMFRIYERRTPILEQLSRTILLMYDSINSNYLLTSGGNVLLPYEVRPGYLVGLDDQLFTSSGNIVGYTISIEGLEVMFIESVTFTAPNSLQVSSGVLSELSTELAKLGLGGI